MQRRFWVAEKFGLLPWDERLLDITADQEAEADEWFRLRNEWEKAAIEEVRRDAEAGRR